MLVYLNGIGFLHDHVRLAAFADIALLKNFLQLKHTHFRPLSLSFDLLWPLKALPPWWSYLNDKEDVRGRVCDGEDSRSRQGRDGNMGVMWAEQSLHLIRVQIKVKILRNLREESWSNVETAACKGNGMWENMISWVIYISSVHKHRGHTWPQLVHFILKDFQYTYYRDNPAVTTWGEVSRPEPVV